MNKTRQAVESVNFRVYFKVIIRQNDNDDFEMKSKIYGLNCMLVLVYSYIELQDVVMLLC